MQTDPFTHQYNDLTLTLEWRRNNSRKTLLRQVTSTPKMLRNTKQPTLMVFNVNLEEKASLSVYRSEFKIDTDFRMQEIFQNDSDENLKPYFTKAFLGFDHQSI